MSHIFRLRTLPTLSAVLLVLPLLLLTPAARAQFSQPQTTQVHDTTALRPPLGAKVAIVEFEDLECPDCAKAHPMLREASAKYHIPYIHHDFPLPFHIWSFDAAVNARWFDRKLKKIGEEYRDQVFANQQSIRTGADLRTFTEKFAKEHKLSFPFAVDPQGTLTALVKADYALGQRIGIERTPTIWIVSRGGKNAAPFVEVVDRSVLYQLIDQAIAATGGSAKAAPKK
jgi:protein-disulfide isomerase